MADAQCEAPWIDVTDSALMEPDTFEKKIPLEITLVRVGWLQSGRHVTGVRRNRDHKADGESCGLSAARLLLPAYQAKIGNEGEPRNTVASGVIGGDQAMPEFSEVLAITLPMGRTDTDTTIPELAGLLEQATIPATLVRQRKEFADMGARLIS